MKMDVVADVLKQADATKLRVATQHIENLGRNKPGKILKDQLQKTVEFEKASSSTLRKFGLIEKDQSRVPASSEANATSETEKQKATKKVAMQALETVLATKMVEGMMPKDQSRLYGEGTAGEIWRGLHIEAMGKALAGQGLFATTKDEDLIFERSKERPRKSGSIVPFAG
jgi:primosomal protein N'